MNLINKTKILIFCLCLIFVGARAQDIELANSYYVQGEYEKAIELYKKVSSNKSQAIQVYDNYLNALYKTKNYDAAEKVVKNLIRANEGNIIFKAEYARFYEQSDKNDQAENEYKKVIALSATNEGSLFELHNFLYKYNKIDKVVELILKSRELSKDATKYEAFLAKAYLYLGDKEKMLNEILNYGARTNNLTYIETTIQDNIKTDEEVELLEKILYNRIQTKPNEIYYSELLLWFFIEKSDFARAFIQAKAIDHRANLEGSKIFELASTTFNYGDFKNSAKMYKYMMDEYPGSDNYILARRFYIQSKEEIIKNTYPINTDDIKEVLSQYQQLINELGINQKTIESYRNMALLNAFYLTNYDIAIELLENAIKKAGTNQNFIDQSKLDLGDIYILKNEPWESTLLYMQVEKTQKENNLGEIAKLKNARLQYFTGQFELSKELLDILKKATTREISNDAMQLSLLIDDNTGLDSNEVAMKDFAHIDLLIFQNKYLESLDTLNFLAQKYKTHSLADEIHWQKANIELKLNKIDEAIVDLDIIIKEFNTDILADDALYTLAKVYEENKKDKAKAMELYKHLLKDYPGSVFCAQARIKYRELRGDFVN